MPTARNFVADGLVAMWDLLPLSSLLSDDRDAVLMYHSVDDRPSFENLYGNITPTRLERDLRYVLNEYRVTDLRSLTGSRDRKRIAVTFDDGFHNFYTNVVPILRKYDVPATVFVTPGIIDNPELTKVAHNGITKLPVAIETVLMDEEQLLDLVAEPLVTIGNHTRTHQPLDELNPAGQRREITGGKEDLEDLLDISVWEFSYPYGAFDSTSAAIVKEEHDLAVTGEHELVEKEIDVVHIPRINAHVEEIKLRKDLLQ